MKSFLKSGDGTEPLDSKVFSAFHGQGQIADYLLWNRAFIAEMKAVHGYPAARMSRLVIEELRKEPRAVVFGTVGVHRIFAERPGGLEANRQLVKIGGRPIRKLLQQANPQVAATREKLSLPQSAGLAIILVDSTQKIEASVAAYAVRDALQAEQPALDEIDFVWVSMESHELRLPNGQTGFPELCIWRADGIAASDRYKIGQMLDGWAHFNGCALECLDHTAGWETMRPVGEGWPLSLGLE
ncbi:hypothetical protein [Brevundimonas aurifodinae]|uniref:Uncharacterized protein n=1 Tax=Brevundimonas aurifodinae TaxID=1508312 RepID=A0ABV1NIR0_9CAUL